MASENWKDYEDWVYPYKNIRDPKYIKDRDKTFAKHGNGWWWLPTVKNDKKEYLNLKQYKKPNKKERTNFSR